MTYIVCGISIFLYITGMILIGTYNLYMLQLNTYLNNEQRVWLKNHVKRQRVLELAAEAGLLCAVLYFWPLRLVMIPVQILLIWYYIKIYTMPHKKKFVWTARVKRMFTTYVIMILLLAAAMLVPLFFLNISPWISSITYIIMALTYFLAPHVVMAANAFNRPIEKAVGNYYINDAKKILKKASNLKIIGITGSYGKTSVKYYLDTLLKVKYNVLKTPGSFNTPMGVVKTIRGELKQDTEIFLCEMGARYTGEIKELCDIVHPHDGIITSIGPQHLETFGSMENIISTKYELADAVDGKGKIFLNGDCDYIRDNAGKYKDKIIYSAAEPGPDDKTGDLTASYYATDVTATSTGTKFTVVAPDGQRQQFEMRLIGIHNVINVVGAIAIAHSYDIRLQDLVVAVRRLRSAPHRLQMLPHGNVTVIDDAYNSNPVGSKAAVETLGMFEGTRILVTPGMVELGEEEDNYNKAFGTYAAANCDYVALVGEVHTKPIKEGLIEAGFDEKKIFVGETLQEAMQFANTAKGQGHRYILLENDLSDNYL